MLSKLKKQANGFTIIEVMIVLAIAALILVVVLIAVPQLQRNQRNSARRDISGRIKAELDNFAGNNNGTYPAPVAADVTNNFGTSPADTNSFLGKYLRGVNINDPQTGAAPTFNVAGALPSPIPAGTIVYRTGVICNGEVPNGAGSARNYALAAGLEGNASFCLDNR